MYVFIIANDTDEVTQETNRVVRERGLGQNPRNHQVLGARQRKRSQTEEERGSTFRGKGGVSGRGGHGSPGRALANGLLPPPQSLPGHLLGLVGVPPCLEVMPAAL